jgi:serine/threonine protein kinase
MGIAYRAIDVETQEEVVLKLLLANLQKQPLMVSLFEDSARAQQSLEHPNIAPILRTGREQGISFIVQPYYANGALDRWFRQIDLDIVVQAFYGVCRAVQFAHERGEIHGDIKSSNVLIGAEGQILLTDFMSSRALSQVLVSAGIRWGTPLYMAPEILISGKPPDVKADIYALGLLLFEAVTGYLPRQLDERVALASRIQAELPLALDPKYNWINDIIRKAVHPNPGQRFNSVQNIIAVVKQPEIEYQWPHYVPIYAPAWLEFEDDRPSKDVGEATYSIGSDEYCDITIRTPGVFDRHAEIDFRDGVFLIRRVNEDGKLYLNGEWIRVARVLHRGDQIRVGDSRIRFVASSRDITRQLTQIRSLPIAWLRVLEKGNEERQMEIIEDPVRIVDEENAYVEIQPIAGKLRLLISGFTDPVLVNQVPVDKTDLSEGDIIEWRNKRWNVHYAHDKWMEVIDRSLLKHGEVNEHYLLEIPSGCRLIAVREYAVERSYLDISFSADTGYLRCNDIQRLQLFRQLWADSRDTFDKRIGIEVAAELVELIKEKLSISEPPIGKPSDRLGSRYGGFMAFPLEISSLVQGLDLPQGIPLILAKYRHFSSDDFSNLLQAVKSSVPMPRLVMIIFLDDTTELLTLDAIEQLQQAHAIDVLALGREDVQRILFARDPRRSLRTGLLSNINLVEVSPFVITGPTYRRIFFGRERELREVTTNVGRASFALIGGRRFGKTSLLLRLHKDRLPTAGCRTLYYDCSTTPTYDAFLAAAIHDWRPEPPPDASTTFGELLRSPPADRPLVLLLDEADKLVPADRANGWPLFNTLRALANSGRAQVVLSGERTLRAALRDPKSPLFNFANEILLGPLDFRAVEELVTRPMKQLEIDLVNEKAIVDRIWTFTSGHPNVVQRLCHHLIERLNEQGTRSISLGDVNAVIEAPQFQEIDFLQTYWEAATPLEKIITLVLSQEARTYRLKEVRKLLSGQAHIQLGAAATKDALDRLADLRSILKRSQAGYAFAVEAFPRVLANTTTVEDLLEVLVEQYERTEQQR